MRQVVLLGAGEPVVVRDAPDPGLPAAGEIAVRMRWAPVNPADRLLVAGSYAFLPSFPHVVGAEGAGEVIAVGANLVSPRVGDHVILLSRGNWSTHRRVPAEDAVVIPPDLPWDAAATLRINPATAWRLLRQVALRPGDAIVQNGAGSSVARWVRRLAADLSCSVIDVVHKPSAELPDALVDGEDLAGRISKRAARAPVVLALDCVAGEASGRLATALSSGASLIVFGHLSGAPCTIDSQLLTRRSLLVRGFSLRPDEDRDATGARESLYRALARIAAEPGMTPVVAARYPLDAIGEALAHAARPGVRGRVMLDLAA